MGKVEWVGGEGPIPCEVMFVGEAPAEEEIRQGRPFVGKTGAEFTDLLVRIVGLHRSQVYVTNVFKYRVPDSKKVEEEEWEWMMEELGEEVERVKPQLIVTLGAISTHMLLGDGVSVEAANGVPHQCAAGYVVIPVIHPAAPFHDGEKMGWVREGMREVRKWIGGEMNDAPLHPFGPPPFDVKPLGQVLSGNSLMWGDKRCIGVDTETYDDMKDLYMITVATGTLETGYKAGLINLEMLGNMEKVEQVAKWVGREDVVVVVHNALFDLPLLKGVGIIPHSFVDTMQLTFLLQGLPIGLKPLAYRLCQWRMEEFEELVGKGGSFPLFHMEERWRAETYALTDPVATLGVLEVMKGRMYEGVKGVLDRDQAIMPYITAMEGKGMKVDVRYLEEVGRELEVKNIGVLEDIREATGMEDLNPNSPKQMNEAFYGRLGLGKGKRIKETVWGKSTDRNAMKVMREEHEVVRIVEEYRETETLVNKYVKVLPGMVGEDGRVHTDISLTRVQHSGRLASSRPNLMAIPVRTEDGRKVRGAFVAEEGYEIMSADYNQIEMVVMAHLSQDPVMMEAYRKGKDIHTETAARIFGIKASKVDEIKHRYPAKRTGFGIINHISPKGLARELADGGAGVWGEAECRDLLDAWFEVYKGVATFMKETEYEVRRNGYVTDMWGRRFVTNSIWSVFPHLQGESVRVAGSALISGGAQGVIKEAMRGLWPTLVTWMRKKWAWPLIQVHDSLDFEVKELKINEVVRVVKAKMEGAGRGVISLPTLVEVKVGKRWGEQKKI